MKHIEWKEFLQTCRKILGKGSWEALYSDSWCAFTTFSSLRHGIHYWCCGFPDPNELLDTSTVDGGLWRQSFMYDDLAHVVVPATFYWEGFVDGSFNFGEKNQDLISLSNELNKFGIKHRKTELILEVKLY